MAITEDGSLMAQLRERGLEVNYWRSRCDDVIAENRRLRKRMEPGGARPDLGTLADLSSTLAFLVESNNVDVSALMEQIGHLHSLLMMLDPTGGLIPAYVEDGKGGRLLAKPIGSLVQAYHDMRAFSESDPNHADFFDDPPPASVQNAKNDFSNPASPDFAQYITKGALDTIARMEAGRAKARDLGEAFVGVCRDDTGQPYAVEVRREPQVWQRDDLAALNCTHASISEAEREAMSRLVPASNPDAALNAEVARQRLRDPGHQHVPLVSLLEPVASAESHPHVLAPASSAHPGTMTPWDAVESIAKGSV